MIELKQLIIFSVTSVLLIFTLGPDIIYVMTRGIAEGKKSAFVASLGFSLGNIFHITLMMVGLSSLIASSEIAMMVLKTAGALYLIYLGINMIKEKKGVEIKESEGGEKLPLKKIFTQSIIANMLNPKVIIFFMAFFPQFINYKKGNQLVEMITLGTLFIILTLMSFTTVAYFSGFIGTLLQKKPCIASRINKVSGTVLILLGVHLLFMKL